MKRYSNWRICPDCGKRCTAFNTNTKCLVMEKRRARARNVRHDFFSPAAKRPIKLNPCAVCGTAATGLMDSDGPWLLFSVGCPSPSCGMRFRHFGDGRDLPAANQRLVFTGLAEQWNGTTVPSPAKDATTGDLS